MRIYAYIGFSILILAIFISKFKTIKRRLFEKYFLLV